MTSESQGMVSQWSAEQGWGVIESVDTPGGCWAHFSTITGEDFELGSLDVGQVVTFTWVVAEQDGYAFRTTRIGPPTTSGASVSASSEAYCSNLSIVYSKEHKPGA